MLFTCGPLFESTHRYDARSANVPHTLVTANNLCGAKERTILNVVKPYRAARIERRERRRVLSAAYRSDLDVDHSIEATLRIRGGLHIELSSRALPLRTQGHYRCCEGVVGSLSERSDRRHG